MPTPLPASSAPIACTLTPGARADRVRWIAQLNHAHLRSHHRHGPVLELNYASTAAAQVRRLVREERACCAFLRFDLTEEATGVRLSIEAPPEAWEAMALLFEPFLSGVDAASSRPPSAVAVAGAGPAAAVTP